MVSAAVAKFLAAETATQLGIGALALSAEGARKSTVSGSMQRDAQEKAARKAEQMSKQRDTTSIKIRQSEKRAAGLAQEESVFKNPFRKKGTIREQHTIGGGGSGYGANV